MFIKLLTAAHVGGVLRHPHEGVLHVGDEDGKRLVDDKAGEDVTSDFAAKDDKTPTETVSNASGGEPSPAPANPHQVDVAPQAVDDSKPARKGAASKE